jgi:hypothetical protein
MLTILPLLFSLGAVEPDAVPSLEVPLRTTERPTEIGHGYLSGEKSFEVKVSRAFGTTDTGSNFSHDLWLTQVLGGLILADVMEPDYWFGGNLEAVGQLLLGAQDNPDGAYFFGLNGGFRYHFRTGTAFAPYLCGSIGIAITDIETPDSSGKFQFNEQIGFGTRYLLSRHRAITLEYDYWHVSNGGIREPNDGVNAHIFSLGFAWLF